MPQQYRKDRARIGSTNVWRNLALTFIVLFVLMLFILAGVYSSVSSAQSNANYWQNQYYNLQSQYNKLQSQYNSLQRQYKSLIYSLGGSVNWSGVIYPGNIVFEILVPYGYIATSRISISASAPVDVYVFDPFQYYCFWTNSCSYNYEYYVYGTNINDEVTLSNGGEYLFVIKNINNYPVQVSVLINTTYVPSVVPSG
jgi:cell division protein FtsB